MSEPSEYDELINNVDKLIEQHLDEKLYLVRETEEGTSYVKTDSGSRILNVIGYERNTNYIKRAKQSIYDNLNIKYCPYCDELPIREFEIREGVYRKEYDLDHYYPKSVFPYLSMSLYNLIPTCKSCNQILKRDKIFSLKTHLNPYSDNMHDDFTFLIDYPKMDLSLRSKIKKIGEFYDLYPDKASDFLKDNYSEIQFIFLEREKLVENSRANNFVDDLKILLRYEDSLAEMIYFYNYLFTRLTKGKVELYNKIQKELLQSLPVSQDEVNFLPSGMNKNPSVLGTKEKMKIKLDIQDQVIQTII